MLIMNPRFLQETLCHKSCLVSRDSILLIYFPYKYPYVTYRVNTFWGLTIGRNAPRSLETQTFAFMAIFIFGQSFIYRHLYFVRDFVSLLLLPFDISVATVYVNASSMTFSFIFHISLVKYRDLFIIQYKCFFRGLYSLFRDLRIF